MITAMMSWYDEEVDWLWAAINNITALGARRLVAVDGAYALFPDGGPRSAIVQADAIITAAADHRLELLMLRPNQVWANNEVGKRQAMMTAAVALSDPGDWLMIYDVDYVLEHQPPDLNKILGETPDDVAEIAFTDCQDEVVPDAAWYPMRMFLRAIPGIVVGPGHYTYTFPDGRVSTILNRPPSTTGATKIDIQIRHRTNAREPDRRQRQITYYEARDSMGVES